jgi:hypothetical protein
VIVDRYTAVEHKETGAALSYCCWSERNRILLPRADYVAFGWLRPGQKEPTEVGLAGWERVVSVVGHLMQKTDHWPERFLVEDFPTAEQLEALGLQSVEEILREAAVHHETYSIDDVAYEVNRLLAKDDEEPFRGFALPGRWPAVVRPMLNEDGTYMEVGDDVKCVGVYIHEEDVQRAAEVLSAVKEAKLMRDLEDILRQAGVRVRADGHG